MIFDYLPTEVIIKILEYLPPEDVVVLTYVSSRFQEMLTKFPVQGTLNLEKSHLLSIKDIKRFFHKNALAPNIKTLILDGMWWFDPVKQIIKCKNVSVLHMMDVKLTTLQFKTILLSCKKIEDLAFSWPRDLTPENTDQLKQCEPVLRNIKRLKFLTLGCCVNLNFLRLTPNIRKLVIITDLYSLLGRIVTSDFSRYAKHPNSLGTVSFHSLHQMKIVTTPMLYNIFFDRVQVNLAPSSQSSPLTYELLCSYSDFRPMGSHLEDVRWFSECEVLKFSMSQPLEERLQGMTFPRTKELFLFGICRHPATELLSRMPRLTSLHFFAESPLILNLTLLLGQHPSLKKLSFRCFKESLTHRYVLEGLDGFTELTHLCVPPCVLEEKLPDPAAPPSSKRPSFVRSFLLKKRPRLGESKASEKASFAAFNRVLDACPALRVLEIARFEDDYSLQWYERFCRRPPVHWQCVENIKKLSHLTHLTLEFIPINSGAFLLPIAEGCLKLEVLRLKDLGPRGKCVYMKGLTEALPSFKSLLSFRLEENYLLPGNTLFGALSKCSKLERVLVFSAKEDGTLDQGALVGLLQGKGGTLTFAYFNFNGVPATTIARVIKEVKLKKSKFLYLCITNKSAKSPDSDIPLKHSREMLQFMPRIAV